MGWYGVLKGEAINKKVPWYIKLIARIFLRWYIKGKMDRSYQCSGKINWVFPNEFMVEMRKYPREKCTADIQVPYYQLAHWLSREAGYEFSCYTLLKAWGTKEQVKALEAK